MPGARRVEEEKGRLVHGVPETKVKRTEKKMAFPVRTQVQAGV